MFKKSAIRCLPTSCWEMESFKEASRKDGIKCISKRQEKKDKQKAIKGLFYHMNQLYVIPNLLGKFFLVNWLDEEDDVFDVVPSKSVVPPENKNILDITAGTICRVAYSGEFYRAKIIECGTYVCLIHEFSINYYYIAIATHSYPAIKVKTVPLCSQ